MARTPLTPVFLGLRTGLHILFGALTVVIIARAILVPTDSSMMIVVLALIVLSVYAGGVVLVRASAHHGRFPGLLWLATLGVGWIGLLWLTPEGAYLVFPLFFLELHMLGRDWGSVAIAVSTITAIYALGSYDGWTIGGIVGPLVGAGVALLIGLGYQALAREAEQRETLVRELLATRGQLAATEHESGVLAERARLAREIHDTLAQGLSSIQMLLHAAERAAPSRAGVEHIRLARETAASNLADARRFIRELTPPDLDDQGLGGVLRRLADSQWATHGLRVNVSVSEAVNLPMHIQSALLRIAQGAVANVLQHADADTATVTLAVDGDRIHFSITDDGRGFIPQQREPHGRSDSFGLQATRERVAQLGGVLTVESAPGIGTSVAVELIVGAAA